MESLESYQDYKIINLHNMLDLLEDKRQLYLQNPSSDLIADVYFWSEHFLTSLVEAQTVIHDVSFNELFNLFQTKRKAFRIEQDKKLQALLSPEIKARLGL